MLDVGEYFADRQLVTQGVVVDANNFTFCGVFKKNQFGGSVAHHHTNRLFIHADDIEVKVLGEPLANRITISSTTQRKHLIAGSPCR